MGHSRFTEQEYAVSQQPTNRGHVHPHHPKKIRCWQVAYVSHLRYVVHEHVLHAVLEGYGRAGAPRARSGELDVHDSRGGVEALVEDVSPILLYRWPHLFCITNKKNEKKEQKSSSFLESLNDTKQNTYRYTCSGK